ncbi:MAG: hypothetical protein V4649_10150 [Bacteroidota bacterium]
MIRTLSLLVLLICSFFSFAQVKDTGIEQLMNRRMMSEAEIEYNAIVLLPRLHHEKKTDTFNAVLAYWQKNCSVYEPLFSMSVLNAIRNGTFSELIQWDELMHYRTPLFAVDTNVYRNNVLSFLKQYRTASHGKLDADLVDSWGRKEYPIFRDYNNFYIYLREVANEILQSHKPLKPIEDYLVRFYSNPDSTLFSELDQPRYANTLLHDRYQQAVRHDKDIHGAGWGVCGGYWLGDRQLSLIGPQPFMGVHFGGRSEKVLFDTRFDIRFGASDKTYFVLKDDSLYASNECWGLYAGADLGFKIFRAGRSELDVLGGFGYDMMSLLAVEDETRKAKDESTSVSKIAESANASVGFSYKFFLSNSYRGGKRRFTYVALQPTYNFVHYKNDGGTSLAGNTFMIRLIFGGYSHDYTSHPFLN